jgi:carbamoyl-phosphate synthase large subunit
MLGKKLSELNLESKTIPHFGVKESVFPFNMFPEVDPLLGPEMRSTGEVLGLSESYGYAFYKAQEATKTPLPIEGGVLITVADKDKKGVLETASMFKELGFTIKTTKGTGKYLEENGIPSDPVKKLGFGRPDIVDALKNKEIQVVINTPSGKESKTDDSYIRKTAIKYGIPYITTVAASVAAARGIAAKRKTTVAVRSLQEYHDAIN